MTRTHTYILLVLLGSALYVFKGDPFQPGPLEVSTVTLDEDPDGIPKRTEGVYIPIDLVKWIYVSNQHYKYPSTVADFLWYLLHEPTDVFSYLCSLLSLCPR